ncbi:MAG TPA: S8 family serine peptidase [Candidatus Acidoferrales bacterium]
MSKWVLSRVGFGLAVVFVTIVVFAQVMLGQLPSRATDEVAGFQPILTEDNQGPAQQRGRLIVVANRRVTDAMVAELRNYGTVHGVIYRYNTIVVTPSGINARLAIEGLPFVKSVENDQPRYLTDVGSWDRDIIDVVDVEESGTGLAGIGNPDPREIAQTGAGVHVAVIDTGLIKNWRDFLIPSRVRTDLARAFMGGGAVAENFVPPDEFNISNPTNLWERDTNSHGIAVASHIIGFKRTVLGTPLVVDGVAPGAKIIPLKVFPNGAAFTWSSRIIGAIAYATELKVNGVVGPLAVNISIGGGSPTFLERVAIQDAIANGLIIVVSAGNGGERGMSWPGAFPEVISVGAVGWTKQFLPGTPAAPNRAFWWTRDVDNDPDGSGTSEELQSYVAGFSSRAIPARSIPFGVDPQELDVLAPGIWTVAPGGAMGTSGFFFWAGTSFSSPLTAGVAALMIEKNPNLTQADVENILKATALPMAANDSRVGVLEPFLVGGFFNPSWDTMCGSFACDPVGAGLIQGDAALAATPAP